MLIIFMHMMYVYIMNRHEKLNLSHSVNIYRIPRSANKFCVGLVYNSNVLCVAIIISCRHYSYMYVLYSVTSPRTSLHMSFVHNLHVGGQIHVVVWLTIYQPWFCLVDYQPWFYLVDYQPWFCLVE